MLKRIAAAAGLVLGAAVCVSAGEVVLEVADHSGVARQEWPVCGGVPFASGELGGDVPIELVDDAGTPVPLQCEPLARWEDGSIKWLLVDFFATLEPGRTRPYRLRYSDAAAGRSAPTGPEQRFSRSPANAYRIALKCYELTGRKRWKQEALRWREHFLANSPAYLEQQSATFHVTTYLVRTLALDYHMFRDPRVGEELVRIARWHCDHIRHGYDERGLHYPYLACGIAWWITRDDELLRWPWHRYLDECQSPVAACRKPNDFRQSHFYEMGQLPFFLRACGEAGFTEASPPPRLPEMPRPSG